jgi:hypothetical protein
MQGRWTKWQWYVPSLCAGLFGRIRKAFIIYLRLLFVLLPVLGNEFLMSSYQEMLVIMDQFAVMATASDTPGKYMFLLTALSSGQRPASKCVRHSEQTSRFLLWDWSLLCYHYNIKLYPGNCKMTVARTGNHTTNRHVLNSSKFYNFLFCLN